MTDFVILGLSTALAGVVAGLLIGAIVTAMGRNAALIRAYQRGFWDGRETALDAHDRAS